MSTLSPLPKPATPQTASPSSRPPDAAGVVTEAPAAERGGPAGPEPTRFGDWERSGRCIDF